MLSSAPSSSAGSVGGGNRQSLSPPSSPIRVGGDVNRVVILDKASRSYRRVMDELFWEFISSSDNEPAMTAYFNDMLARKATTTSSTTSRSPSSSPTNTSSTNRQLQFSSPSPQKQQQQQQQQPQREQKSPQPSSSSSSSSPSSSPIGSDLTPTRAQLAQMVGKHSGLLNDPSGAGGGGGGDGSGSGMAGARGGQVVPQFYFPHGKPLGRALEKSDSDLIARIFADEGGGGGGGGGLNVDQFEALATNVCHVSSFCSSSLFMRVSGGRGRSTVTRGEFEAFYFNHVQRFDYATRLFNILKMDDRRSYLTPDDFKALITEVVTRHRGLEFLEQTPEFQYRYVQTVVARIFYHNASLGRARISLTQFKRGNFPATLAKLDTEDDVNKINDYFSYEHFYVIYCKFWELDNDHDFFIDIEDLARYDNYSLTNSILERIMSGIPVPISQHNPGRMSYEDFITFFISEVDKTQPTSIDYWFNCIDLDGDGIITVFEMEPFLQEQRARIQALAQEPIQMTDLMCQINDMIHPDTEGIFRRTDLRRSRLSANFFNILFNMNRYAISESKDPFLAQQIHDTPDLTDWDRYALSEYYRLAEADEQQDIADRQQSLDDHMNLDADEDMELNLLQTDDDDITDEED